MLSALVRWGVAVWLVEKLTDRQIDQIGPTLECSMRGFLDSPREGLPVIRHRLRAW